MAEFGQPVAEVGHRTAWSAACRVTVRAKAAR